MLAFAINGKNVSAATTSTDAIEVAAPTMNYASGVYEFIDDLSFSCETPDAKILYMRMSTYNKDKDIKTYGSRFNGYSLGVFATSEYRAIAYVVTEEGDTIWSDVTTENYYISPIAPFKPATSIESGSKYLLVSGNTVAGSLLEDKTSGAFGGSSVTISNGYIQTNDFYGFTFTETGENTGEYYIQDAFDRYVYTVDGSDDFMFAADATELGDAALWSVEFGTSVIITNKGNGSIIGYTSFGNIFAPYGSASEEALVLYTEIEYPTLAITPNGTESLKSFSKVTISCESGISSNESDELYPYYNIGWDYTELYFNEGVQLDNNTVVFELDAEITENNTYRVILPAGLFTLDPNGLAIKSEEIYVNLTVDNAEPFAVSKVTPANGSTVEKLDTIMIEYTRNMDGDNLWGVDVPVTDQDGNVTNFKVTYGSDSDPMPYNVICLVTDTPITAAGTYTLVISKEFAFVYNAQWSTVFPEEDVICTFTIQGDNTDAIEVAAPTMNYASGVYEFIDDLSFSCETPDAKILYMRMSTYNKDKDIKTYGSRFNGYSLGVFATSEYRAIAYVVTEEGDTIWSDVTTENYYISPIAPFKPATSIESGSKYLLVSGNTVAGSLLEDKTSGAFGGSSVTISNGYIQTNDFYGFTFTETGENTGEYYIQDAFDRYVYTVDGSDDFMFAADATELGDAALWSVEFGTSVIITNKGNGSIIGYTSFGNIFAPYGSASEEALVLYTEIEYPTLAITPNGTESLKSFSKVTISCESGISSNESDELYPYYNIGWDYTELYFNEGVQLDNNTVVFELDAEITENNTYRVILPAGLFTLDPNGLAIKSEEIYVNLTVDNAEPFAVSKVTPANGSTVEKLDTIMIEYTRNMDGDNLWGVDVPVTDQDGNVTNFKVTYGSDSDPMPYNVICLVTDTPITAAGTYTLVISKEFAFVYNAQWSTVFPEEDVICTFTIGVPSGIESVVAETEGEKVIYDMTGRRIKNVTKSGIYIINGVKTIIK